MNWGILLVKWFGKKSYEKILKGSHGVQFIRLMFMEEKSVLLRISNQLIPNLGMNIITTIDAELQRSLEVY